MHRERGGGLRLGFDLRELRDSEDYDLEGTRGKDTIGGGGSGRIDGWMADTARQSELFVGWLLGGRTRRRWRDRRMKQPQEWSSEGGRRRQVNRISEVEWSGDYNNGDEDREGNE
jgi:hypothetical protein